MPTVIIPPTDVSPNTGSGSEVLSTSPNLLTPTLSVGATTTGATDLLINPTTKASGNLIDAQVNGASKFSVTSAGAGTLSGNLTVSGTGQQTFSGRIASSHTTAGSSSSSFVNTASNGYGLLAQGGSTLASTQYVFRAANYLNADAFVVYSDSATLAGNLTVSGTTGITATDLTLGTSGPSVKSTLSARAPRQGLVFDGTGSAYATMGSSIGTSSGTIDIVLDIPSSNPSTARGVFTVGPSTSSANFGNTLSSELRTDGKLWVTLTGATAIDYRRAESSSSLVSLFSGKKIRLTVVRDSSASTITIYANGIVLATTETAGGTAPAWSGSVTGTYFVDGGVSPSENYLGYHSLSGFYNRALSASEVVALYESGAPSGADYNNASSTNIITGDAWYTTVQSGTAISSGVATITTPGNLLGRATAVTVGKRYRVSVNITASTGGAVVRLFEITTGTNRVIGSAAGTNTLEFTATSADQYFNISAGTATFNTISLIPLGLLLAPDAAQAGGGLTWYDTSGNAANITLPASGVSWNVPFAGYLTAPTTTNLTLAGGSSGASLVIAQGVNAGGTFTNKGTGFFTFNGPNFSNPDTGGTVLIYSNDSAAIDKGGSLLFGGSYTGTTQTVFAGLAGRKENATAGNYAGYLQFYTGTQASALEEVARLTSAGKLLLKSDGVDSGNGKLQLAESTASTGGIGFGPETYLFRAAASNLRLDASSGDVQFQIAKQGTLNAQFLVDGATLYMGSAQAGMKLILSTGAGVEALRLDSSQNAIFAGSTGVQLKNDSFLYFGSTVRTAVKGNSTGSLELYANNNLSLTLDSSANATFAGKITAGTWASGTAEKLQANTTVNNYAGFFVNTASSGNGYALRLHTNGTTSGDYPLYVSSGAGAGSLIFGVTGDGNATFAGSIRQNQANNISLTSGVATTIFSLGTSAGVYIVTATLDVNAAAGYAIVGKGATGTWQVLANSGTQISFSMSTNDLQITQSSGATSTTNTFNLLRLR